MNINNENLNVSLFLQHLNKCETVAQLDMIHNYLCRKLSVERRGVFLNLLDEHYIRLSRDAYWDTV